MKKTLNIILLSLLYLGVSAQVNLLRNGSFEQWNGNDPVDWGNTMPNNQIVSGTAGSGNYSKSTDAKEGSFALNLKKSSSAGTSNHRRFTSHEVAFVEGTEYTLTYWVKGRGYIRAGHYEGATLKGYQTVVQPTQEWKQITHRFTASSTGGGNISFSIYILDTTDPSDVIIDNVSLTTAAPIVPVLDEIQGLAFSVSVNNTKSKDITIKGYNLSADVSLSLKNNTAGLSLSANSVSKTEAEAGKTVYISYNPVIIGVQTDTVIIKTAGMDDVLVPLQLKSRNDALPNFSLTPTDDVYYYCTTAAASRDVCQGIEDIENLVTYESGITNVENKRKVYLKFDISGIMNPVEDVIFRIYGGDTNERTLGIFESLSTNWAEDAITYNTRSMLDPISSTPICIEKTNAEDYSNFDVTSLVLKALSEGRKVITLEFRELTSVRDAGSNAIPCIWHSKENSSGFVPMLVVSEKDVAALRLADLRVAGITVDNFAQTRYRYNVSLPYNVSEAPVVNAVAVNQALNLTVYSATNLSGTEFERTTRVVVKEGTDSLTYSVVFSLLPQPNEARLQMLYLDGAAMHDFDKETYNYNFYLPYSATACPVLSAEPMDPNSTVRITQTTQLMGGIAKVDIKSLDATVDKQYTITFQQLPQLDIILAVGQSNMAGRAPFNDVAAPMQDVYLLTPMGGMEVSANPMNKYSNIRKDLSVQGLGPSYQCALNLQNTLGKPIGFVVNAQGGSSIKLWSEPGKANYDASLSRAKEAQKYGKIKAIIWHQGSADNTAGLIDNFNGYKSNFAKMVNNFRADLNEPDLYFICGELSTRSEFTQFNETVIQKVSTYIQNSDYIVADETNLLSDGIHFDAASANLMGKRYAAKVMEKVFNYTTAVDENSAEHTIPFIVLENKIYLKIDNLLDYQLIDIRGNIMSSGKVTNKKTIEAISGVYILRIQSKNQSHYYKILIQ